MKEYVIATRNALGKRKEMLVLDEVNMLVSWRNQNQQNILTMIAITNFIIGAPRKKRKQQILDG